MKDEPGGCRLRSSVGFYIRAQFDQTLIVGVDGRGSEYHVHPTLFEVTVYVARA